MRTVLLAAALFWIGCRADRPDETVTVFAAASLTDVMEAFADTFSTRTGGTYEVALNLAGSSLLARQISMGARADLFISAHPTWTEYLQDRGRLASIDTLPISNNLVVVSRTGTELRSTDHVALADPEHVPAGIYAREALRCEGWWDDLEDRIVPTLDVRSALAAVQEGAAEAAIVYASDALFAPELVAAPVFSDACQPVIRYTSGLAPEDGDGGERFLALLQDLRMASTWNRFGFAYRGGGSAATGDSLLEPAAPIETRD